MKIDTQLNGVFIITEDNIIRYYIRSEEISMGLLVKKHSLEVHRILYCALTIREGKSTESVSAYFHTEEDLKDAPSLEKVVTGMEEQLDSLTEGIYQRYVNS